MPLPRIRFAPLSATPVQRKNFINVQIDGIGVGFVGAAAPFLPVFLTRLGATSFQISLLTMMPGVTGLIMAVFVGSFLQSRRNIVPWFGFSRLLVFSSYAATGLAAFVVPGDYLVPVVLAIWAMATLPQTAVAVSFSVVMNAVAGPDYRYDLMSRRWSILGTTTALTVAVAGYVLDIINFPINYQVVFLGLSLGGLVSYYFSTHIELPPRSSNSVQHEHRSLHQRLQGYVRLVRSHPDFTRFSIQRFVFLSGATLAAPIFPQYYVHQVQASDAAIGLISTAQTSVLMVSYFVWARLTRRFGSRFALLSTTLALGLYPALVASTQNVTVIIILTGLSGVFQAGIDLIFFDELMKTVPEEYSATFVSLAQSMQYASTVLSPLVGAWLATSIGLGGALMVSAVLRLAGFALFALWRTPGGASTAKNTSSA